MESWRRDSQTNLRFDSYVNLTVHVVSFQKDHNVMLSFYISIFSFSRNQLPKTVCAMYYFCFIGNRNFKQFVCFAWRKQKVVATVGTPKKSLPKSPVQSYGKLVLFKRFCQKVTDIGEDIVELRLLYAQAVHYVVHVSREISWTAIFHPASQRDNS